MTPAATPSIPVVRGIGAATASLVAQACTGCGVGSGGARPQVVGPVARKAVLWAIAWVEGEPIVAEELAALAGVSRSNLYEAVRSLQRDGLVTVDGCGGRRPNRYRLLRDGLARSVTPVRMGGVLKGNGEWGMGNRQRGKSKGRTRGGAAGERDGLG